jgi:hypothetical protein
MKLSGLNTHETELILNEIDIAALENETIVNGLFAEAPELSSSGIINCLIDENIDINEIYEAL